MLVIPAQAGIQAEGGAEEVSGWYVLDISK